MSGATLHVEIGDRRLSVGRELPDSIIKKKRFIPYLNNAHVVLRLATALRPSLFSSWLERINVRGVGSNRNHDTQLSLDWSILSNGTSKANLREAAHMIEDHPWFQRTASDWRDCLNVH